MGDVQIWTADKQLKWQGRNTLTEQFEIRLLRSLFSRGSTAPLYCGVGGSYHPLTDTPWDQKYLEAEMSRKRISGTFVEPLSQRANLLTAFRSQNINTLWREIALFDAPELAAYGARSVTSCDSLNLSDETLGDNSTIWGTGSVGGVSNILTVNPRVAVEGFGSILCEGEADDLFENNSIDIDTSKFTENDSRLQLHFGLSATDLLDGTEGVEIRVYTRKLDGSDYYKWTVPKTSLAVGHNFLDLTFSSSTPVSSPVWGFLKAIKVSAKDRDEGMSFSLDSIRVYQNSGTMLARAEIYPKLLKTFGSTQIITWVIEPFSQL